MAGILFFWHFAEQAERENEAVAQEAEQARREVERAEQENRGQAADELRARSEESAEKARRIAGDVADISAEAHAAISAGRAGELGVVAGEVKDPARRRPGAGRTANPVRDSRTLSR